MDSFLINVVANESGEWYANYTDGSIPLLASNYQDALMEADMILAENEYGAFDYYE